MKKLIVFTLVLSFNSLFAQDIKRSVDRALNQVENIDRGLNAPEPPCCRSDSPRNLRSMQDILAAMNSDQLRFVGRDYPHGSLGAGGNLSCVYENEVMYIELSGCRPNTTMPMGAFMMKAYFKDGGIARVYVDNENDPYTVNQPFDSRTWTFETVRSAPIQSGLNFSQVSRRMQESYDYSRTPYCSFSSMKRYCVGDQFDAVPCTRGEMYNYDTANCNNGAQSEQSYHEEQWRNPGTTVRDLHNGILSISY